MVTYYLKVNQPFIDKETKKNIRIGDVISISDYDRVRDIIRRRLGTLKGIIHGEPTMAPKVMIHQKYCYRIGGIETANSQLARAFKDREIMFVFGSGDIDQLLRLGKYHDVWIDGPADHYMPDVFIMTNYDSAPEIIDRVKARKVYQQIHADFDALTQMKEWKRFVWNPNPRTDKVLAVSETAQKGLKERFGVDSIVVPNILCEPLKTRPRAFICLSRATPEKGIDRLVKLLKRFDEANKDYILFLCSTIDQADDSDQVYLRENPRAITVQPTPYSIELIRGCDMLIQLSYNESYCYSVREALQLGKPCLVSDCPELRRLIQDGKNGFIYSDDMDIDKLFGKLPTPKPYSESIPAIWDKVLDGKI